MYTDMKTRKSLAVGVLSMLLGYSVGTVTQEFLDSFKREAVTS